jgi:hypothetical protein
MHSLTSWFAPAPTETQARQCAMRLLQQRRLDDAAKLKEFRRLIQTGLADLARSDFVEVETDDLETFLAYMPLASST